MVGLFMFVAAATNACMHELVKLILHAVYQ